MSRLKSRISDFLRDSNGSATIEFLLWMPVLTTLISVSADSALYFGYKSIVMRIVDDANRSASIGRLTSATATEEYVEDRLGSYAEHATVTVTWSTTTGLVTTTVSIPTEYVTATGLLEALNVTSLYVRSQRLTEG